jgi:hypothetical protein
MSTLHLVWATPLALGFHNAQQYLATQRRWAFHAKQGFDRSAVGEITVAVSRYHRRYRTERISGDLSVPGVTQDEPTERLPGFS